MLIGKKIRNLRKEQKMSMTELSLRSGVQLATLSRMENLKMTGTLESHMQISKALAVDITELYSDVSLKTQKIDVKTKETAADIFNYSDKSSYEILTNKVLSRKMMPILLRIDPEGKTNLEQNAKGSEKFLFVLQGKIQVQIDEESFNLSETNTLYFDASLPHVFTNIGDKTVKMLCVTTPVAL
ncbi:MAG: XRE family transcriptional regulator [Candidatus Aceula meridiana]|nr:XRE family transcriptional regulator [Candidatus Aceula meridiana]